MSVLTRVRGANPRSVRRSTAVVVGAGLSLVAIGMMAPAADAAQQNAISGNAGLSYYESATDRHVTTPNDTMQIQMNQGPAGGLSWYCVTASGGSRFTNIVSITSTGTYTLATGVLSGTVFHNVYKGIANAGNFSGNEYY